MTVLMLIVIFYVLSCLSSGKMNALEYGGHDEFAHLEKGLIWGGDSRNTVEAMRFSLMYVKSHSA